MKKIMFSFFLLCVLTITAQEKGLGNEKPSKSQGNGNVNTETLDRSTLSAPVNDNCSNATVLTVNAGCTVGTTSGGSTQVGECKSYATESSVWYRFNTGLNGTINLSWVTTNTPNCFPVITVYGPFVAGLGCLPSCANIVIGIINNGDPGFHYQLTGLSTLSDYLIQIESRTGGGGCSAANVDNFCIGVYTPPSNDNPSGATLLGSCGNAYNGNLTGYSPLNTSAPENLDNNNSTQCGSCGSFGTGADVNYVVNNDSWFTFCPTNASTWSVTLNNISNCLLPPNIFGGQQQNGVQMSVLTGSPTSFTNVQNASYGGFDNIPAGQTWSSSTFAVTAGQCVYIIVDGFAGDECTFNLTVTNVTGGCIVLPIELTSFTGEQYGEYNMLKWTTATEKNNRKFTVEHSKDAINFDVVNDVDGAGNSTTTRKYSLVDTKPFNISYYRLTQTDYNGNDKAYDMIVVTRFNNGKNLKIVNIYNLLGQPVTEDYDGVKVYIFNDGSVIKKYTIK
jgi:hypothetical protein